MKMEKVETKKPLSPLEVTTAIESLETRVTALEIKYKNSEAKQRRNNNYTTGNPADGKPKNAR